LLVAVPSTPGVTGSPRALAASAWVTTSHELKLPLPVKVFRVVGAADVVVARAVVDVVVVVDVDVIGAGFGDELEHAAKAAARAHTRRIVLVDRRVRDVISASLRSWRSRRWRSLLPGRVGAPGHDEAHAVALVLKDAKRHPTTLLALRNNKLLYLSGARSSRFAD
jgi:hypothetical protein